MPEGLIDLWREFRTAIAAIALLMFVAAAVILTEWVWHWEPQWLLSVAIGLLTLTSIAASLIPALVLIRDAHPLRWVAIYLMTAGMIGYLVMAEVTLPTPWASAVRIAATAQFIVGGVVLVVDEGLNVGKIEKQGPVATILWTIVSTMQNKLGADSIGRGSPDSQLIAPVGHQLTSLMAREDRVFQLLPPP
ncbi:hypothetical protein ACFTS5_27765 [Nocardia sp. NPDC056952]|uniref:hypothetical protein n=1 Tax=Nocardia sp. NPDC056952 TaxID=3345979 RepID=UPI0036299A3E